MNDVRIAGVPLKSSHHVCGFFRSLGEQYNVLLPYIKEGLERKDRGWHLVDPARRADHHRRLQEFGISAAAAEQSGQLEVQVWGDVYVRGGYFDQRRMLTTLQDGLAAGKSKGFGFTRMVANMEWALGNWPGVNDLVEYEARINEVPLGEGDAIVCTYDLTRFGGASMMDVLRTHPTVILGSVVMENPFFVPPDRFLQELRLESESALPH
jgi:DcmR-like sensory protein